MNLLGDLLGGWFWWPALALAAGVLALAPLGHQVLARGVVFIDLAVAQAAAAAALWSASLFHHEDLLAALAGQAIASAGALLCAALVAALARRWPQQREALIGLAYVAGASLALLGARASPHGRDRLAELLAADLLWAGGAQAAVLAGCAAAVLLLVRLQPVALGRDRWFYPLFALVASLAVPVLGLFVVFAALIAPALWQRAGASARVAAAGAMAAGALGLAASWAFDAPSGVCVALALAAFGAASVLVRRPAGGGF